MPEFGAAARAGRPNSAPGSQSTLNESECLYGGPSIIHTIGYTWPCCGRAEA